MAPRITATFTGAAPTIGGQIIHHLSAKGSPVVGLRGTVLLVAGIWANRHLLKRVANPVEERPIRLEEAES